MKTRNNTQKTYGKRKCLFLLVVSIALCLGLNAQNTGELRFFNLVLPDSTLVSHQLTEGVNIFFQDSVVFVNDQGYYVEDMIKYYFSVHGRCAITVTANPEEGGTVRGGGEFMTGEELTVIAEPNEGYEFWCWVEEGRAVSTETCYSFLHTGTRNLTAMFRQAAITPNIIDFADANAEMICLEHWDTDGDGYLSYDEAAVVTDLSYYFYGNDNITSFDELQYFIGLNVITDYAFANCSNLASVVLPETVTTINARAFYDCDGFTTITIGENVTTIGEYAFAECSNVTTLNYNAINCNASNDWYGWIEYCSNLHTLNIGEHVEVIPDYAFKGNNVNFTGNLIIPNSVTTIGEGAFYGCSGFQSITSLAVVPPTIEAYSFYGMYYKPLYIPCGTKEAYQAADYWSNFTNMQYADMTTEMVYESLRYEIIDAENHYLKLMGFAEGITAAENLVIPSTIVGECDGYTYTVTEIADEAFVENLNLTGTLTLPATLTKIGNSAFDGCESLTGTLVIPENVAWIGQWAFFACEFTAIHYNATNCTMVVNDYGEAPFLWCNQLQEIVIGDNVTNIPASAFRLTYAENCQLILGNSVQTIGEYAFCNADNASKGLSGTLVIPASVTHIGHNAFAYNYNLTGDLTIPENMNKIGKQAFIYCGFTSIHYNATNCESIGMNDSGSWNFAFWNCSKLEEIVIGDNVTQIPIYAFANAGTQYNLDLGNGVTTINNWAFNGSNAAANTGIKGSLVIPNSVTYIGYGAFYNGSGLTEIWCKRPTAPTVQNNTFYNVDKTIPVHVPCGSLSNYQSATNWSAFTNYLENPYVLVVEANDEFLGKALVSQYASCSDNESIIHAEPYLGSVFVNWTTADGTEVATTADYTFAQTGDVRLVANFMQLEGHSNFVGGGSTNYWSDVNNWSPKELPTATSTVGIWADAVVSGDVEVASATLYGDAWVYVNPDASLRVTDELSTTDLSSLIYIYEGGQLYHSNDDVRANVLRSITPYTVGEKDGWHLIASPLADNAETSHVTNLTSNEYDLYYYDEPTVYWINQKNEENDFSTLENAKGYLYGNKGSLLTNVYFPFHPLYNYSISECLFRASELQEAGMDGVLTSLSWYATNSTGIQQSNISIWMANVDDNKLAATSHTTSNMTLVYSGAMTPVVGWNEFVFSQNFTWDGSSNVLICVQRNNGAWNNNIYWRCHVPGFTALAYNFNDNNAYDMPNTYYSLNTTNTARPDVIFRTSTADVQIGGDYIVPATIAFYGDLKNGSATVTVPLSYTEGPRLAGFNLVGNPYAHNVTSYATANVANGCYRMNETKDDLIVSEISEANPLKPTEGFFVKATSSDASVTFNPQQGDNLANTGSIRVEIRHENKVIDRLIVKNAEAQPLEKFSLNEQRTKLFAQAEGVELAIVPCEGNEQPVSFKAAKNGTYTIHVNVDGLEFNYLHLIDNLTGEDIDILANPTYTFDARISDYASRFRLVFLPKSVTESEQESFAYFINGKHIIANEGRATLQVIDMLGHILSSEQIEGTCEKQITVAPGVYMLRLLNGDNAKTQKIVINN